MLSSVRNVFRIRDLRGKILFTLLMIGLYRIGAFVPAPGIDLDAVEELKRQAETGGGVVGFLQLFSGGALTQFAIFALGIMPYITASIIMQILTRGDPQAGGVAADGGGGPAEDHPVDPLPRGHHRPAPGHRPGLPVPQRWRWPARRPRQHHRPRRAARLHALPRDHRGVHPHRRARPADVDGRADQPARHRQRHVAADLRVGGRARSRAPGHGSTPRRARRS